MPDKTIRFNCDICKATVTIVLDDDFQKDFKSKANKWPYPLIFPHKGHWAIVHLDDNLVERGVTVTKAMFK